MGELFLRSARPPHGPNLADDLVHIPCDLLALLEPPSIKVGIHEDPPHQPRIKREGFEYVIRIENRYLLSLQAGFR